MERREAERISPRANVALTRRSLLALAGAGLALGPCRVAGQSRTWRIGVLEAIPAEQNSANLAALRRGLREHGYVEGRNLVIEYRSADGRAERFPELANDLVRRRVDLIVARGTPATRAAQGATRNIPVVMATMGDPRPLVASFAHPGGNVTGLTTYSTELSAKRVELLKELAPKVTRVGLLHDMGNLAARPEWEETRKAARALGLDAQLLDVRDAAGFERAFTHARRTHVDGLVVGADGVTQMHRGTIVDLVLEAHLPAAFPGRDFVEAGGLFAYALDYTDLYYRFASFVDRIFKGAKPGELPIEQPARFELVINVATAQRLGLTIPPSLRLRADALIG